MAAIDFPASPTTGQVFTAAGVTWKWDGAKWGGAPSGGYLPLAGGAMTGPITLAADPVSAMQPTTKRYVDDVRDDDNRVINGDMRINQRGVASGTAVGYTVDRWSFISSLTTKGTWAQSSLGALVPGFSYCLGFQSNSAYAPAAGDYFAFQHKIEADMISDFAWGGANAQPVTLSFWAQSSLTGTFGGCVQNQAVTRTYPFTFSLPTTAWTKIAVTIPGDTGGTWILSGNASSVLVLFDLGTGTTFRGPANVWAATNYVGATGTVSVVSTANAYLNVTGVKLEIGSTATPYIRQSLAKSMADCQRYYQKLGGAQVADIYIAGYTAAGNGVGSTIGFPTMRAMPAVAQVGAWATANIGAPAYYPSTNTVGIQIVATAAGVVTLYNNAVGAGLTLNAEL